VRVAGPHEELSHPYWCHAVLGQIMGFMISGGAGGMTICDPCVRIRETVLILLRGMVKRAEPDGHVG
jgi:hypothetical protein